MVSIELAVATVSIGFLVAIVAVMGYFAFSAPSPDLDGPESGDTSTAD